MRKIALVLSLVSISLLGSSQTGAVSVIDKKFPNPTDGSGSLGEIYNHSDCGLNYVQVSVKTTTRYPSPVGTGFPTTLPIAGLPSCFAIEKAYLWCIASYQTGSPPASTVSITNPASTTSNIPSTIIGTGGPKCWGETGTAVYRTDVTSAISGNGNYTVNLSGFSNINWEVDGVTLFIIYRNPTSLFQGTLILDDGDITSNTGAFSTQTMQNVNSCSASNTGSAFILVADMQDNIHAAHPAMLNGVNGSYINNFYCFDLSTTTVTNNQLTASYSTDGQNADCYTWALMGLYFQTTTCTTCTFTPSNVVVTAQSTNAQCGFPNGSATSSATGGTSPYTYSWSTSPPQTTQNATGIGAGTYIVYVTDATGCNIGTDTVTVTNTGGVGVNATSTNVLCSTSTNGTASASPVGGQSPFTYLWSNSSTTQNISNLSPGTYIVIITDASGCTNADTVTIVAPAPMSGSTTSTAVSCNGGNNGGGTLVVTGGTGPFTYLWSPSGGTNSSATGLSAGSYTVTVTDANGCTFTQTIVVTQPQPMNINIVSTNVQCYGGTTGAATASASGGASPYTYAWNTSPPQNTQNATGLVAGTYIISVIDVNGCMRLDTVVITQPPIPTDTLTILASFCEGDSIGTLYAPNVNGPFQWYFDTTAIPNATTNILIIVPANLNHYTITWYLNGCIRRTSVKVMTAPGPYFLPDTTANVFTPNGDGRNDIFYPYQSKLYNSTTIEYYAKDFSIKIYDRWGNLVYESNDYKPQWDGKIKDKEASAGVYYWVSSYVSRCGPDNAPVINKGFVHLLR